MAHSPMVPIPKARVCNSDSTAITMQLQVAPQYFQYVLQRTCNYESNNLGNYITTNKTIDPIP